MFDVGYFPPHAPPAAYQQNWSRHPLSASLHHYTMMSPPIGGHIKGLNMIRILAKLFAVAVALTACLPVQPSSAESVAFVSASGGGTTCTQTAPCGSIFEAVVSLPNAGGRVVCATPVVETASFDFSNSTYVFDCPSSVLLGQITFFGNDVVLKFQHMGFSNASSMIKFAGGGGTLIFEDCVLEDSSGVALDIEPGAPFNLVIKNSRISNNTAAGVLIKPAAGGSVTATFDGVTITNNAGGLRTDTTNGAVRVDISNSTINNNANNGVIAIGGAGGQNVMNLSRNVIASNGQVGIEVSGTTAGAIVDTTLLDSNTLGALSAVSSGRILTYQNNRIVGSPGTGFTGTASPQ